MGVNRYAGVNWSTTTTFVIYCLTVIVLNKFRGGHE